MTVHGMVLKLKLDQKNVDDYSSLLSASAVMIPSPCFSSMPLLHVDQNPKTTFYIFLMISFVVRLSTGTSVLVSIMSIYWMPIIAGILESLVLLGEYSTGLGVVLFCFVCAL